MSLATPVEPTADEQYMLELLNRARANPTAEAWRLVGRATADPALRIATQGWDLGEFVRQMSAVPPQPPLAFNTRLIAAARAQNAAMLARNDQFHAPTGFLVDPAVARAADGRAYYPVGSGPWATGENVFAYSQNVAASRLSDYVDYLHAGLLIDWGNPDFGHLKNLLNPGPSQALPRGRLPYGEVGIGLLADARPVVPPPASPQIRANAGLNVGPVLVTQEFGWRWGVAFLTGTVYQDRDRDDFYTPGEGLGGVTIQAVGLGGQGTFVATTWGSGGYALALPPGTYAVTAAGNVPAVRAAVVTIGADNVGWTLKYDAAPPADLPVPGDYDGDGITDVAVFRPDTATWYVRRSRDGVLVFQFGCGNSDLPIPADYDGDGITDLAVFRPTTATWYALLSGGGALVRQFGAPNSDVPIPADYDGDGIADLAVFRPATATWYAWRSREGPSVRQFGEGLRDVPVPADYDGDGIADLAAFRPDTATWYVVGSRDGVRVAQFGWGGVDLPIPADYDGDGRADLAVYRPITSQWGVWGSTSGPALLAFGTPGDGLPIGGDYDGDGRADLTLYSPSRGWWSQWRSASGPTGFPFGRPGPSAPAASLASPSLANAAVQRPRFVAGAPASAPRPRPVRRPWPKAAARAVPRRGRPWSGPATS